MTSGVTAVPGFVAGGIACGIKPSGDPDLALVATDDPAGATAAGVFTTNLAQAAPVQVSRRHLGNGRASAVVLSSGNANAATGAPGRRDATRMCELAGQGLGRAVDDVLVCSTGLIGIPMPMDALAVGIPKVCGDLSADGGGRAARAIMTTDTKVKEAVAHAGAATVGGMAKGAAMLSPAMATMLAVLTTDAEVDHETLQRALARAVSESFDCLSVDGCRSTNDTVVVLANGRAGAVDPFALTSALSEVCGSLAEQMARDAEGATKFVRVRVVGRAERRRGPCRRAGCREQPARAVFAERQRSLLGARALRTGCERCAPRSGGRRHLLQRHHRVPRWHRVRARRDRRDAGARADRHRDPL